MRSRRQGGFTLIEVLIAVLLLAIGVVGAAGTQLAALRTRHGSALMSDGVQLASSLAERMRANTMQWRQGDGANAYLQLNYEVASGPPPAPALLCHGAAVCGSAAMATFDQYEIAQVLHAAFPGGRVTVCRDAAIWDDASERLSWACSGGNGAPVVVKLGWYAARGMRRAGPLPATPDAPSVAMVVSEVAP